MSVCVCVVCEDEYVCVRVCCVRDPLTQLLQDSMCVCVCVCVTNHPVAGL